MNASSSVLKASTENPASKFDLDALFKGVEGAKIDLAATKVAHQQLASLEAELARVQEIRDVRVREAREAALHDNIRTVSQRIREQTPNIALIIEGMHSALKGLGLQYEMIETLLPEETASIAAAEAAVKAAEAALNAAKTEPMFFASWRRPGAIRNADAAHKATLLSQDDVNKKVEAAKQARIRTTDVSQQLQNLMLAEKKVIEYINASLRNEGQQITILKTQIKSTTKDFLEASAALPTFKEKLDALTAEYNVAKSAAEVLPEGSEERAQADVALGELESSIKGAETSYNVTFKVKTTKEANLLELQTHEQAHLSILSSLAIAVKGLEAAQQENRKIFESGLEARKFLADAEAAGHIGNTTADMRLKMTTNVIQQAGAAMREIEADFKKIPGRLRELKDMKNIHIETQAKALEGIFSVIEEMQKHGYLDNEHKPVHQ